jgi:hypothetical protein
MIIASPMVQDVFIAMLRIRTIRDFSRDPPLDVEFPAGPKIKRGVLRRGRRPGSPDRQREIKIKNAFLILNISEA